MMEWYRWFWSALTALVLLWYSTITVYIAYQGFIDIRKMLKRLENPNNDPLT
jgi:succinate dehydrogenase hydrophobic anchor subunit